MLNPTYFSARYGPPSWHANPAAGAIGYSRYRLNIEGRAKRAKVVTPKSRAKSPVQTGSSEIPIAPQAPAKLVGVIRNLPKLANSARRGLSYDRFQIAIEHAKAPRQ